MSISCSSDVSFARTWWADGRVARDAAFGFGDPGLFREDPRITWNRSSKPSAIPGVIPAIAGSTESSNVGRVGIGTHHWSRGQHLSYFRRLGLFGTCPYAPGANWMRTRLDVAGRDGAADALVANSQASVPQQLELFSVNLGRSICCIAAQNQPPFQTGEISRRRIKSCWFQGGR